MVDDVSLTMVTWLPVECVMCEVCEWERERERERERSRGRMKNYNIENREGYRKRGAKAEREKER